MAEGDGFSQRKIINPCDNPQLAKQCLIEFKQACKKTDTKFCLWYGTALGVYRDGAFIPEDHDIDVLIILDNNISFTETLDKITLELDGWEQLWIEPKGQCHYYKKGILLDVWFMKKDGDQYISLTRFASEATHSVSMKRWPKKHFDKLDEIKFMGCKFPIPAHIEEYLEKRYKTWKKRLIFNS